MSRYYHGQKLKSKKVYRIYCEYDISQHDVVFASNLAALEYAVSVWGALNGEVTIQDLTNHGLFRIEAIDLVTDSVLIPPVGDSE